MTRLNGYSAHAMNHKGAREREKERMRVCAGMRRG